MALRQFTDNATWITGLAGQCEAGYRTLKYSGSLGGGTLSIHSLTAEVPAIGQDPIETPLADAKLTATTVDDNGDAVKQVVFQTSGMIVVKLTGATSPDAWVAVE